MDISIPAAVTRENDIDHGDVFTVETDVDDQDRLTITYTRVYDGE